MLSIVDNWFSGLPIRKCPWDKHVGLNELLDKTHKGLKFKQACISSEYGTLQSL